MISPSAQRRLHAPAYAAVRAFDHPSGTVVRYRGTEGRTVGGAFVAQGVAVVLVEGAGPAIPLTEIEVVAVDRPAPVWVLVETLSSRQRGRPVYFLAWTGIGPAATENLAEAARFASQADAARNPACSHFLSFYEPLELESLPEGGDAEK